MKNEKEWKKIYIKKFKLKKFTFFILNPMTLSH